MGPKKNNEFGGMFSTGRGEWYVSPNLMPKPSTNCSTKYRFSDLVDVPLLQQMLNSFYITTGIPHGIIDVENNILSGIGWQDICTQFHRFCPGTLLRCQQSDSYISDHLQEGSYVGYKCLNGLMDYGTPIIVEGRHLATIFLGQFFHEPPDEEFFRQQAQEYGFDEAAYMEALRRVPIITEEKIKFIMEFYSQLSQLLAIMGLDKMRRKQSEERYRMIFEYSGTPLMFIEEDDDISMVNREFESLTGYSKTEIEGKLKWTEFIKDKDQLSRLEEYHRLRLVNPQTVPNTYETKITDRSGQIKDIMATVVVLPGTKQSLAALLDITERKLTEEELSKQREHLEEKVMERTKQLSETNAELSKEIGVRRQAETELQEANRTLADWVSELEERTAEMSQLSEMGEQLQSCHSIAEACAISAQYIQKLFPSDQGALYLISPANDLAEAVEMWGDSNSTEKMFIQLNCWAIRRGRSHLVDDFHPGLLCGHIIGSRPGQYLCVPMIAHGEAIGILHLNHPLSEQDQQKTMDKLYSEHKTQLAVAVAEHIALALSNIKLRETIRQ